MVITDFTKLKVTDYLKRYSSGAAAFIFNHGLGDLCLFLPLFEEIKKQFSRWRLHIICQDEKNFKVIHPYCLNIGSNSKDFIDKYRYTFRLSYPEPPENSNVCKPYYCNKEEIGLENFEWKPYKLFPNFEPDRLSKVIGFHFKGNSNAKIKNINDNISFRILQETRKLGFHPFICNEISFEMLISAIKKCKYFIGIESGPLYLAGSILGFDKVIGLQRNMIFKRYLPLEIKIIEMKNYQDGQLEILNILS